MDRVMIVSGENKGKSGEVIGMFHGAGICVVKAEDGKEYVAKLDEIKKVYPIEERIVIGLPKEMVEEISQKHGISIYSYKGNVCFHDNIEYREYEPLECEEEFLDALKKEYGIALPVNYNGITLFAADGDQNFGFYIGIMF